MFSSIISFFKHITNAKYKKEKKETDRKVKQEEIKILKQFKNRLAGTARAKAKEAEAVKKSDKKAKKLKAQVRLLKALETFVEFLEFTFGTILASVILIVLCVAIIFIVVWIALNGILHVKIHIIDDAIYTGSQEECIDSQQVLNQNKLSDLNLSTLQGTLTPYQQNLFKLFTLYEEFIYGNGTDYPLMRDLPPDVGYKVYRGICACETGFEFWSGPNDTGHDILKDMCVTNTSTNYVGPFAMDRSFSLLTDELLQGHKWGSDKDSNKKYVEAWKNKYPKPSGDLDQYWTPYGAAMTVLFSTSNGTYGGLNTSSNKYAAFEAYTKQRIADFGIVAKSEECYQYIRAFLSLSCFLEGNNVVTLDYQVDNNRATKHGGKARIDFLCALFAASSDDDSKRDFNNYSIILNEDTKFSYSAFSGSILEWIYTDCTGNPFNNTTIPLDALSFSGNPRIKVGDMELTVPIVRYVYEKYNELYPQGIENMDDTWYHLKNSTGQAKAAYWYGFAALLQGNHIEAEFGVSMPLTSGGNIEDCECYEGTTGGSGGVGTLDISNLQEGVIQGDWPEDVKQKMTSYGWNAYFGQSYSTKNPDAIFHSSSMTYEEWRQSTKWKVPYQNQSGSESRKTFLENWKASAVSYGSISWSNACHVYMSSYIASALTGDFINMPEMFAALRATGGVSNVVGSLGLFSNTQAYKTFEKLGIYFSGMNKAGKMIQGSDPSKCSIIYPSGNTIEEKINAVLDAGGIVGVTTERGNYTAGGHYFVITERQGNQYKTFSASHPECDIDWHPLDYIIGPNGSHLRSMRDGSSFYFAYNPNLNLSQSGGGSNSSNTISIPSTVKQSGLIADFTDYAYFYPKWNKTSNQRVVADLWASKGKKYDSSKDIATIDGHYLVACVQRFGAAGDGIVLELEDGTKISCIIGDIKSYGDDRSTEWGHSYSTGISLIEWEAMGNGVTNAADVNINLGDWQGKKVKSITNYGSYLSNSNIFPSNLSNSSGSQSSSLGAFEGFLFVGDSHTDFLDSFLDLSSLGHFKMARGSAAPSHFKEFWEDGGSDSAVIGWDPEITVSLSDYDKSKMNGIVVMLGSNAPGGYTETGEIAYMIKLLEKLKSTYNLPIFVQRTLPVGIGYSNYSKRNSDIDFFNQKIQEYCNANSGFYYIDTLNGLVASDGTLMTPNDKLHMTGKSLYETWYSNIENAVRQSGAYGGNSGSNTSVECISSSQNSGVSASGAIDLDLGVDDYTEKIKAGSWGHSYTKTRTKDEIKFIVVHFWGSQSKNSGDAQGLIHGYETGGMNREDGKTYMAQYVVDKDGIYRTAPDLVNVQHSGGGLDKTKGSGYVYNNALKPLGMERCTSNNSIGIEASNSDLNNTAATDNPNANVTKGFYVYEKGTIENLISLTKALMIEYNIDVDHIYRHYDCTMKTCPAPFIDDQYLWPSSASEYDKGESQNWKAFKECLTSDTIDWSKFNDHVVDNIK